MAGPAARARGRRPNPETPGTAAVGERAGTRWWHARAWGGQQLKRAIRKPACCDGRIQNLGVPNVQTSLGIGHGVVSSTSELKALTLRQTRIQKYRSCLQHGIKRTGAVGEIGAKKATRVSSRCRCWSSLQSNISLVGGSSQRRADAAMLFLPIQNGSHRNASQLAATRALCYAVHDK